MESSQIFNKIDFQHRISIKINELNNVINILDLLYLKVRDMFNRCFEYGYLKENSIVINTYSNGFLNPITFVCLLLNIDLTVLLIFLFLIKMIFI